MNFDDYRVKAAELPEYPRKPVVPATSNPSAYRAHADALERYLIEKKKCDDIYEERAKKEAVLIEKFHNDALREVGLEGHPNAEKAYTYAWRQGHSAGLSEVFLYLEAIAEVLL